MSDNDIPAGVTSIQTAALQALVTGHIDNLWYADQIDGCCAKCCMPCKALMHLLIEGQLDALVHPQARGSSEYWDSKNNQVSRLWLKHAWRLQDCAPHVDTL